MVDNYVLKDFGKILKSNHQNLRSELGGDTNVMRVYDKNLESLRLSVDLLGSWVQVTNFSDADDIPQELWTKLRDTIASNLYVSKEKIIYKHRKKGEEYKGSGESVEIQVKEDGAIYNLELLKKQDIGLFLDNYKSRLLVKELSFGLDLLNLFSYTCAYSVQAARGGAHRVVSVDTSKSALLVGEKNMADNGFVGDNYSFIQSDVFDYLSSLEHPEFDIVIADVPSFSNAHGGRRGNWDVQKDHIRLINAIKRVLRKEGIILFRTNLSTFSLNADVLSDFKIFNYTREMLSPGFTKKSQQVKTYVLKLYNQKKFYINPKNKRG